MPKRSNDFQKLIAQIMELLDNAEVVESREFPDPDTGTPREVDVYVLLRGQIEGREVRIAVECVDRKRKMDLTWIDGIYGKHSVLQVADIVLLVSASGFTHSAEIKARKRGMHAITPTITPKKLERAIASGGDGYSMGMSVLQVEFENTQVTTIPGVYIEHDDSLLRSDGTACVSVGDYRLSTLLKDMGVDLDSGEALPEEALAVIMPTLASESVRHVTVPNPTHKGEPLYVWIVPLGGIGPVLTPVLAFTYRAKCSATERATFEQTHVVDFDGLQVGTGTSTLDGKPARMVVVEGPDGSMKAVGKGQVYVK